MTLVVMSSECGSQSAEFRNEVRWGDGAFSCPNNIKQMPITALLSIQTLGLRFSVLAVPRYGRSRLILPLLS